MRIDAGRLCGCAAEGGPAAFVTIVSADAKAESQSNSNSKSKPKPKPKPKSKSRSTSATLDGQPFFVAEEVEANPDQFKMFQKMLESLEGTLAATEQSNGAGAGTTTATATDR